MAIILSISMSPVVYGATVAIDDFTEAFDVSSGTGGNLVAITDTYLSNTDGDTYTWTDSDSSGTAMFGDTRTVNVGPVNVVSSGFYGVTRDPDNNAFSSSGDTGTFSSVSFSYTDATGVDMSATPEWAFDIVDMDQPAKECVIATISLSDGTDTVSAAIFFTESTLGFNSINLDELDDYDGYGTSWSSSDWDSIKTSVTDITVKYFSLETDKDFRIASKFFTDVSYGGLIQAPEPSSLFLLGTVFTGYMLRSRSRRQR